MAEDVADIDLYEAVCLMDFTVADVPPEVSRRLLHHETDVSLPLIAVVYRGSVPIRRRRETNCFIGTAPHLGYLFGVIRAAVDQQDARARAMFTSAHDQGYAAEQARRRTREPGRQDL